MANRRAFLCSLCALALHACDKTSRASVPTLPKREADRALASALVEIERATGGRLGVAVLDTGDGRSLGHRADERFGMCSTFKLSLAALVLREADAGRLRLDEQLHFTSTDLIMHSPVTEKHVADGGLTIEALAEAAQRTSDNTATNLLLVRLGGPPALTAFWRELGDEGTRLDRIEPDMNLVPPGEVRDTAIPRGLAAAIARYTTGEILTASSRARLLDWMERTETGKNRLRAGLPSGWRAGDKTGTGIAPGMPNKTNDLALLWPPGGRAPIVVTAFLEADAHHAAVRPVDERALAEVGRAVAAWA